MFGQEDVFKILAAARLLHSARKGDFFTSTEAAGIPPVISTQPNWFFGQQRPEWLRYSLGLGNKVPVETRSRRAFISSPDFPLR